MTSAEPSQGAQLAADWFGAEPPSGGRRARKHALADQMRVLLADLTQLDTETCDEADLTAIESAVADAVTVTAGAPTLRGMKRGDRGDDANLFERSPFSGRSNPLAPPLWLAHDGVLTTGRATFTDAYEGPPGCVHGGHVVATFDELLGVAQIASGAAGMTGTLTVKLRATTPIDTEITYVAGVTSRQGRKITVWGRAELDGALLAEAEGIFIAAR